MSEASSSNWCKHNLSTTAKIFSSRIMFQIFFNKQFKRFPCLDLSCSWMNRFSFHVSLLIKANALHRVRKGVNSDNFFWHILCTADNWSLQIMSFCCRHDLWMDILQHKKIMRMLAKVKSRRRGHFYVLRLSMPSNE